MIANLGQGEGAVAIVAVPVVLVYLWQEHGHGGRWKSTFDEWSKAGGLLKKKKKPRQSRQRPRAGP